MLLRIKGQQVEAVPTIIHDRDAVIQTVEEFIKLLGLKKARWIGNQWRNRFDATLQASLSGNLYLAHLNTLLTLLSNATPLLLLWIGVGAVASGTLSLGQMLALVVLASSSLAPLGADKSTLGRLLPGLYRPQRGVICYDGRTIDELGVAELRREIGVVLQDAHILGDTIRQNIVH